MVPECSTNLGHGRARTCYVCSMYGMGGWVIAVFSSPELKAYKVSL